MATLFHQTMINFFTICISYLLIRISTQTEHIDTYLRLHNAARAAVGVRNITWDPRLAIYAANRSYTRIKNCNFKPTNGPYGENIAHPYQVVPVWMAVQMWLKEKPNYNHTLNKCVGGECSHYTQMVWRDSVRLGCYDTLCPLGVGAIPPRYTIVSCYYDPPGNRDGERPY